MGLFTELIKLRCKLFYSVISNHEPCKFSSHFIHKLSTETNGTFLFHVSTCTHQIEEYIVVVNGQKEIALLRVTEALEKRGDRIREEVVATIYLACNYLTQLCWCSSEHSAYYREMPPPSTPPVTEITGCLVTLRDLEGNLLLLLLGPSREETEENEKRERISPRRSVHERTALIKVIF